MKLKNNAEAARQSSRRLNAIACKSVKLRVTHSNGFLCNTDTMRGKKWEMISQKQLPPAADITTACINIHFNISAMLIRNIDGLILRGKAAADSS